MSAFDELDALMLDVAQTAFGDLATLHPMKQGSAGINAALVPDDSRPTQADISVIQSKWTERGQIGGNGMPTPPGAFKLAVSGMRHVATVTIADLDWLPTKGDELEYAAEPGVRYRIAEPMPDGLSGLHLALTRI
ncbi:hypothetical protein [Bosea sp. BK604]|uniref:hypothetical protein n=1 Tax=Bosea sp. BK604 TaxID=2512180 RepID=UPI0010507BAF|nr:hypothetical protein [Bosea sp. BK604]TCR69696.1 hypothetical protein EV560_10193 [Bosea sp. BK604]